MDFGEILGNIPENLSQYELARYIYIRLGQYFSYNEKYYISDTLDEKKEIFDRDIETIQDDKAVCSQFSKIYVQLLQRYGIDANEVFKEGMGEYVGHSFVTIKIDDKVYYTDMTRDLMQIKMGFKTQNFMKVPEEYKGLYEEISDDELSRIDSKIGYTYKGMYMDETMELLRKDMQALSDKDSKYGKELRETLGITNTDTRELLEYKIEFLKKYFTAENLYSRDRISYFMELLKSSATQEGMMQFDVKTLSCVDKENNVRMFLYITDKEIGDSIIYTFTDEEYASKIDEDFVKNLVENGLRPVSRDHEKKELLLKMAGYEKENEQDCYHFTYLNRVFSIAEKGLIPRLENNSKAVGDKKEKVSYSIGKIGAIGLFANFYTVYDDYKTGKRQPREDKPGEMEQYKAIMESKNFEEFIGEGIYLTFDGTGIENTGGNTGRGGIYDASTIDSILPEKLKVCLIKNQTTGEISYSKFDYIHYLMSTLTPEEKERMPSNIQGFFDQYYNAHLEEIESFKDGKFSTETMEIKEFCEKYKKEIEEDLTKYSVKSTQELGKEVVPEMSVVWSDETEHVQGEQEKQLEDKIQTGQN